MMLQIVRFPQVAKLDRSAVAASGLCCAVGGDRSDRRVRRTAEVVLPFPAPSARRQSAHTPNQWSPLAMRRHNGSSDGTSHPSKSLSSLSLSIHTRCFNREFRLLQCRLAGCIYHCISQKRKHADQAGLLVGRRMNLFLDRPCRAANPQM